MYFPKQAKALVPTQIGALPQDIATFTLNAPNVQQKIVDIGEWKVCCESRPPTSPKCDILAWWDSMASRLPALYSIACRVLAIPHTSCDVEFSFSVWKHVHSKKQNSMKKWTHKAYILLQWCCSSYIVAYLARAMENVSRVLEPMLCYNACPVSQFLLISLHFPSFPPLSPISLILPWFPPFLPHFSPISPPFCPIFPGPFRH